MSSIENEVVFKVLKRAEVGKKKYDNPLGMDRKDLSRLEWLIHAQEEALDLAVYLEKLINEEKEKKCCEERCCESGVSEWVRTSSMEEPQTKESQGDCLRSSEDRLRNSCK